MRHFGTEQGATNTPPIITFPSVPLTTPERTSAASSQGLGEGGAVQGGDDDDDDDDEGGGRDDDGDDDGDDDEGGEGR